MRKILFPFDFENDFCSSFKIAARLARRTKSTLLMVNTFQIEVDDNITPKSYNERIKQNWLMASRIVLNLQESFFTSFAKIEEKLNIKFEYRFVHSIMNKEIIKSIEEEDVLAIVYTIPSEPKRLEEFKKTAFEIIDNHKIPILIVPEKVELLKVNNIAFATNYNKLQDFDRHFKVAIWLADIFKSNLHFVHIDNDLNSSSINNKELNERINKLLKANSDYKSLSLNGNGVLNLLSEYIKTNDIDMVFTVGRKRNFFEKTLGIEKGDSIFLKSSVPVWVEYY